MSQRNARASSIADLGNQEGEAPQATRDFPEEGTIFALMQMGFTYSEARDMAPDESDRYLALRLGYMRAANAPQAAQEPAGPRKATQEDIDAFFGNLGLE